jgi:hypothetical protein
MAWREVVVIYFKIPFRNLPVRSEETMENINQVKLDLRFLERWH